MNVHVLLMASTEKWKMLRWRKHTVRLPSILDFNCWVFFFSSWLFLQVNPKAIFLHQDECVLSVLSYTLYTLPCPESGQQWQCIEHSPSQWFPFEETQFSPSFQVGLNVAIKTFSLYKLWWASLTRLHCSILLFQFSLQRWHLPLRPINYVTFRFLFY